jgi:hypothetical protein
VARLTVRVTPRAGRNGVDGFVDGTLRVRVAAAPSDGAANHAAVRVLARTLGVAPSRVRLIAGAASRIKTFEIEIDESALRDVLARYE